jgi:hypothetical protein
MADDSELRMRYGYEGDEEEGEKKEKPKLKIPKFLKSLLLIAGIIAAGVIAYLYFIPAKYKIVFAVAVVLIAYVLIPKDKRPAVLIAGAAVLFVVLLPQISLIASEGKVGFSKLVNTIKGVNIEESIEKTYGQEAWKPKGEQQLGSAKVNILWAELTREPSRVLVPVQAVIKSPLKIIPTCFIESGTIATSPSELIFTKSDKIDVSCVSPGIKDKIGIKMTSSSDAGLSNIEIWAGKGNGEKGKINLVNDTGPYVLEMNLNTAQPISNTTPITLKLRKASTDSIFELSNIDSFKVDMTGNYLTIQCPAKMTGSKEELKGNFKDNAYSFICDVIVNKLPDDPSSPERDFVNINVKYQLEGKDSYTLTLKS